MHKTVIRSIMIMSSFLNRVADVYTPGVYTGFGIPYTTLRGSCPAIPRMRRYVTVSSAVIFSAV